MTARRRYPGSMVGDSSEAVKEAALGYIRASYRRDWAAACELLSRPAQGIFLMTAAAEGHVTTDCVDAFAHLMASRPRPDDAVELSALSVEVLSVEGERARVRVVGGPDEAETLTFVLEDESWKLAARGLND